MPKRKGRLAKKPDGSSRGARAARDDDELYSNEVDDFMEARDRVMLQGTGLEEGESSDEDGDGGEEEIMGFDDSDDSGENENAGEYEYDELDEITEHWGNNKRTFYQVDEEGEYEAKQQEEEEAKRLQRQQLARYGEDDFGVSSDDDEGDDEEQEEDEELTPEMRERLEQIGKDVLAISMDDDTETISSKKRKQGKKLTKKEKLAIIKTEAPELMHLLREYKKKMSDVTEQVGPALDRAKSNEYAESNGISFLEVKYQVLLSYCMNIAFYLLLKASGRSVRDHPVIDQLVKLRVLMDKLQPIDKKLKYQIEKTLKRAMAADDVGEDDADEMDAEEEEGLSFAPKPGALMDSDDDEGGDAGDMGSSSKLYQVPKNVPVYYDDVEKTSKKERSLKRRREKAARSEMMGVIHDMYTDAPEEESVSGAGDMTRAAKIDSREEQEYEERNFQRLAKKKTKGSRLQIRTRLADDLEDFGEVARARFDDEGAVDPILRAQKEGKFMQELEKAQRKNRKRKADEMESTNVEEDPYYLQVMQDLKRQKVSKEEKRAKKAAKKPALPDYIDETVAEGEKREASWAIMSNRGLVAHKRKALRNRRVHLKEKFATAKKKRKSMVREVRNSEGPYGGEATGINKMVVKSQPLK